MNDEIMSLLDKLNKNKISPNAFNDAMEILINLKDKSWEKQKRKQKKKI